MNKLIDLGSVSEETKGANFANYPSDGTKVLCNLTPSSFLFHLKTNDTIDDVNVKAVQFACLSNV